MIKQTKSGYGQEYRVCACKTYMVVEKKSVDAMGAPQWNTIKTVWYSPDSDYDRAIFEIFKEMVDESKPS